MSVFETLRASRSARRVFWVLFVGFLLIFSVGSYIVNLSYARHHNRSRALFAHNVVRTIHLLQALPPSVLKTHARSLAFGHVHVVKLMSQPEVGVPTLTVKSAKLLRQYAVRHFYNFKVNTQLPSGQWVLIKGGQRQQPYLWVGFALSMCLLLILLLLLCLWVVRYLAMPVAEFERATKRFGMDVQAPPMAAQGSPEMRAVIQAFNEMQGRIRRLITDRTQMLAAISHDLRTPITRLQLRIEALQGSPQYAAAEADLNEMERMIRSILAFARDYVRTEPMERFDLVALVDNICNELQDTGLAVQFESDELRAPYFGRLLAIKRALTNLIENAVKYGSEAQVTLSLFADGIKVMVCDQGPGIPESDMEKVFAPFYRLDPARMPEKSGSGLGLSVARDIVRAHGGDIVLTNREQGGLQVLVTLPLVSVD